ncbi:MAG TPA: PIG-L deacetylase family protein [Candidatus Limnocylindria bacterium]|jgi:LmbE family N-acetylglucosaminyl deacetylase|nr:PIG-L deacetylase family protein [Candidatus Limnocylindria bacterium]
MERVRLFADREGPKRILALGAHSDDIEIGCGGTILRLAAEQCGLEMLWVVFVATGDRAAEAHASAKAFLEGVPTAKVLVRDYPDRFLPYSGAEVKEEFEALKHEFSPDVIFTHYREDRHQDHRLISDLTWNTWRDHLILEYEVPKYDGDFGSPNFFAALPSSTIDRKVDLLLKYFRSQQGRHWFTADLFRAVARIRGMECNAPEGFAEGFYARKARF